MYAHLASMQQFTHHGLALVAYLHDQNCGRQNVALKQEVAYWCNQQSKIQSLYSNHTYTHTHLYLYLPLPETGHVAPINLGLSQEEATRPVAPLAVVTPASSLQLQGTLSVGLARPMSG